MAGSANRNLFLQVNASTDQFSRAMKSAVTELVQFGDDAGKTLDGVRASLAQLGTNDNPTKGLVDGFRRGFSEIEDLAKNALKLPTTSAGALNLDVKSVRASADAATAQAASLRELADAADQTARSQTTASAASVAFASSALGAAARAEQYAASLREEAAFLEEVQGELNAAGRTTATTADVVTSAHGRMSTSAMILQHSVRSGIDSFSAGLPISMIFGEQISRLGEAAAFAAQEGENSSGVFAKFGAFMGGPWGLALSAALAILGPFVAKLFEADDALKLAKIGNDGLSDAQGVLGKMFDLTSGKLERQNSLLRLNAQLTALNLRAEASKEKTDSAKTFTDTSDGSLITRGLDAMATNGRGQAVLDLFGLESTRNKRNASLSAASGIVNQVRAGKIDPSEALRQADKLDYSGLKVTKQQLEQAIVDATSADFKNRTADEIEQSLRDGQLAPDLRNKPRDKKPRSTLADDDALAAARAKLAAATNDVEVAEANLAIIEAQRRKYSPDDYQAALTQADKAIKVAKAMQQLQEEFPKLLAANIKSFDTKFDEQSAAGWRDTQRDLDQASKGQSDDVDYHFQNRPSKALDDYSAKLHADTDDMNKALNGVEADGLKGLEDGLVGIATGTETVSQAFTKMATSILADLARIAIEKEIVAVFGLSDGGLVGGGSGTGYAEGGLPGFADGVRLSNGMIAGPGTPTSDSILALVDGKKPIRVSRDEGIVNARAVKRYWPLIDAMNKGTLPGFADGGLPDVSAASLRMPTVSLSALAPRSAANNNQPLYFDLRNAVLTPDLLAQMQQMALQTGGAAYQASVEHTNDALAGLQRPRL